MLTLNTVQENGVVIKKPVVEMTDEIRLVTMEKYQRALEAGTLLSDYDDNIWAFTDEKNNVNVRMISDDVLECLQRNNVDVFEFIDLVKTFVLLRLGACGLSVLRLNVEYLLRETARSDFYKDCENISPDTYHGSMLMYYIGFLKLVGAPEDYQKACHRLLAVHRLKNADFKRDDKQPCTLNEFQSYFKLDDIIRRFRQENTDEELKRRYYPFIIFWLVTTVLPLRVTEFCVTPRDCLDKKNGKCFLTVRRTRLKGSSAIVPKTHAYKIDEDYEKYKYEIPEWLYDLIDEYRKMSAEYDTPYGLLFSKEVAHDAGCSAIRLKSQGNIFSSESLNAIVDDFYVNVIAGMYNMTVIDEDELLERFMSAEYGTYDMMESEIMVLKPKHTRHLAMINLILRGCNPMVIKEFAGHATDAMSAHYYGNTAKLVRCATKMLYDKVKSNRKGFVNPDIAEINPLSVLIDESSACIQVDGGLCYSKAFAGRSPADCAKVNGVCHKCRYFIADKKIDVTELEEDITCEAEYIGEMLADKNLEERMTEFQIKMQQLSGKVTNLSTIIFKQLTAEEE